MVIIEHRHTHTISIDFHVFFSLRKVFDIKLTISYGIIETSQFLLIRIAIIQIFPEIIANILSSAARCETILFHRCIRILLITPQIIRFGKSIEK